MTNCWKSCKRPDYWDANTPTIKSELKTRVDSQPVYRVYTVAENMSKSVRVLGAGIVIALLLLLVVPLTVSPRLRIALRMTSGFERYSTNSHVYVEPGAESRAMLLDSFYAEAIAQIQERQVVPFHRLPRIYLPASHESFCERIGLPLDSPVRGLAFARDVWLSPLAFNFGGRDTHRASLLHELSHVHLTQELGYWNRAGNIPAWFSEGLSNWSSNMVADDVSRRQAILGIKSDRVFVPDTTGQLPLPRMPGDYGIAVPLLHMQARLFVDFLEYDQENSMNHLITRLLEGAKFSYAFNDIFGVSFQIKWDEFLEAVKSDRFP